MGETLTTRHTVLVVDDNPDLLRAISISLEEFGSFKVVTANDGAEGLERYYEERPACLVIDIRMPGVDGYQLVRALRGDPETWDTPMVILTALAQDQDRFTGLAAGADVYLTKPVKPQDLAAAIHQAIITSAEQRTQQLQQLLDQEPSDE